MFKKVNFKDLIGVEKKTDPRLVDSLTENALDADFVVAGYPDDEGIKNNGGREGAKLAPDIIRKYFYKMRPSILFKNTFKIFDQGNLNTESALADRHESAVKDLITHLKNKKKIISFGGGHDYGYVDGKAFLETVSKSKNKKKPLIINFDAHFDVRNLDSGITSGTPFFRLLEKYDFDFLEIGIQEQCNTKAHFEYLKSKGAYILFLKDIYSHGRFKLKNFTSFMQDNDFMDRDCFLSVDIDAFSNAYAPGCSQSFSLGLEPQSFFAMFDHIVKKNNVPQLGIYEVSPPLDLDDHTSKLAALIAYKFLYLK